MESVCRGNSTEGSNPSLSAIRLASGSLMAGHFSGKMRQNTSLAVMYVLMYIYSMSRQYSIVEARNSLPRIVDQAEAGAEVQLTRRGKPVAAVVGLRLLDELRGGRTDFRAAYGAFLDRYSLADVGLEPDVFAGREKGSGRKVAL